MNMTREIKFRGKSKETGKWVYGDLIQCDGYYTICNRTKIGENEYETLYYEVIPESVGQYTGLKDKNGKEIYEGDIVKCKAGVTSNLSVHGPQKVEQEWTEEIRIIDGCWMCKYYLWEIEDREVIGNIYQNKDLINI